MKLHMKFLCEVYAYCNVTKYWRLGLNLLNLTPLIQSPLSIAPDICCAYDVVSGGWYHGGDGPHRTLPSAVTADQADYRYRIAKLCYIQLEPNYRMSSNELNLSVIH